MRADLLGRLNRWMRREPRREPATAAVDSGSQAPDDAAGDADLIVPRLCAEPWYVDKVTIDGPRVSAAGWSMRVDEHEPAGGWFRINGQRFDHIRYPLPRADVGAVFWQRNGSSLCGFDCAIDDLPEPYPNGVLEIQRVVSDTPRVERGRDSWFAPDPARQANLPDADRRFRVIGDRDPVGFLISGATDYHRMDRALLEVTGKHLHEFAHVLDWGAGCGRVARHLPSRYADALTGCDIDRDNVDWCAATLPGTFVASRLAPPLPFESGAFDLVYGISVFTHLREPMQLRWLEELARVAQRGAILLMTTHGQTAIDFSRMSPAEYRRVRDQVRREGIVVSGMNTQLDGHAEHGGEYVNVYHSTGYVRQTWGRWFEVLHILPGYILHHDLVVLHR
ncbi:MAG: class I SAM-dependent methyltransferase [Pseudomonadota bacterium]|nr:class I SAM-dependent methyltransferase [Pseudomonadota bacterium]